MVTKEDILKELEKIVDPEMGVNIVDLGLIYEVDIMEDKIDITFTLTNPGCPHGAEIQSAIVIMTRRLSGIKNVNANLVWEPFWDPANMTEGAKFLLGYPI